MRACAFLRIRRTLFGGGFVFALHGGLYVGGARAGVRFSSVRLGLEKEGKRGRSFSCFFKLFSSRPVLRGVDGAAACLIRSREQRQTWRVNALTMGAGFSFLSFPLCVRDSWDS